MSVVASCDTLEPGSRLANNRVRSWFQVSNCHYFVPFFVEAPRPSGPKGVPTIQSSRTNEISKVELWRYGPFRRELSGFVFGAFPARSS